MIRSMDRWMNWIRRHSLAAGPSLILKCRSKASGMRVHETNHFGKLTTAGNMMICMWLRKMWTVNWLHLTSKLETNQNLGGPWIDATEGPSTSPALLHVWTLLSRGQRHLVPAMMDDFRSQWDSPTIEVNISMTSIAFTFFWGGYPVWSQPSTVLNEHILKSTYQQKK